MLWQGYVYLNVQTSGTPRLTLNKLAATTQTLAHGTNAALW